MNNKQTRTLKSIFSDPVPSNIPWRDIEQVILALGGEISEGKGSRVKVKLNGVYAVFHRPHPEKVTDKGAVKSARMFLLNAGVVVEEEDVDL
jgi:hypothetical protein